MLGRTSSPGTTPAFAGVPASIVLSSSAFASGETIPPRYAGRGAGDNVSPPLAWSNVPPAAAELVLVLEDPDAPMPRPFVHLIATGIDPQTNALVEGALSNAEKPARLHLGRNTAGRAAYMGPARYAVTGRIGTSSNCSRSTAGSTSTTRQSSRN